MQEQELIDSAEITNGQAVVTYSRTAAAVAELRKQYEGAKYDLTTTAGDKAARAARLRLVTTRTDLEKKRKELKSPAVEFGRKVDAEAARLTAELIALETPIDAQIKADEARREAERRAKEEAEAARKKVHTDAIAKIAGYVGQAADLPAARIAGGIAFLEGMELAGFEEFAEEAGATRTRTIAALQVLHAKATAREAEEARLKAEREEQARVAAAQAETARQLKAQQEELARKEAALAEESAKLAREQEAREAEERRKVAAAEAERVAAADRQARQELEAAERRAQQATMTHTNGAPMFGEHIKPNGDLLMLDDQGKRSVFCDLDEGDEPQREPSPAPAAGPAVIPMPTRAPAAPASPPTLRLGQINERLAPLSIDAAGLAALGFPHAATDKSAKLFHEADFPRICTALVAHLTAIRDGRQEAA